MEGFFQYKLSKPLRAANAEHSVPFETIRLALHEKRNMFPKEFNNI